MAQVLSLTILTPKEPAGAAIPFLNVEVRF
jgi:hypothetical protein